MKRSCLALFLLYSFIVSTPAQQTAAPPAKPQSPTDDRDQVVRITTNLVQVDATVVDRSGKQITDLKPEDFEILEDGRPQPISNFSYVPVVNETVTTEKNKRREADKFAPPTPPEQLQPEQVRRSIALIVDDLGLSFESVYYVRRAIKKFVDEQMRSGDLVAIIRTGAGVGALQQFTTDKQLLYAAINRIKWNAYARGGI
ncbi:MAG TPA: VWA domain-containing protein, partial [Pyrinomonadaceae bacterium]|nr:VWA domain-containing protein [Pyrinomonadaceae bacterium]